MENSSPAPGPAMAGIGHNKPPVAEILGDAHKDMTARLEAIAARANEMPRTIDDESGVELIAAIVKDSREIAKAIDKTRLSENEPLRAQIKEVDGFFRPMEARATRIKDAAEAILTDYNRRLEAERRRMAAAEAERARAEAQRALDEAAAAQTDLGADIAIDEARQAEARAAHQAETALGSAADLTRQRTAAGTVTTRQFWTFAILNSAEIPLDKLRPYFGIDAIEKAIRGYVAANKDSAPLPGVRIYQDTKASVR